MIEYLNISRLALAKAAPVLLILPLAACQHQMSGGLDDYYMPQMHYERHPVEVAKGTVKLKVPTRSAALSPAEEDAIVRFAQQARDSATGVVHVQRPAGGMVAGAVAGQVSQILARHGVDGTAVSHSTYKAGAGAPVVVSFVRKFAVTGDCGDWSADLAESPTNSVYSNFGCAQQHNLAAMVANPEDFNTPRTAQSQNIARRQTVLRKYVEGEEVATQSSGADRAQVSEVAK